MNRTISFVFLAVTAIMAAVPCDAVLAKAGIVYEPDPAKAIGKHIVFVVGDEEYRSEESMPMLAKILTAHHGFRCTVLWSTNKQNGQIDPMTLDNIPGLEALETADLMVMFLRFRELPDDQMKHIIDYTNSGKPIVALRTSTHAFNYKTNKKSKYAKYSFRDGTFKGGYGRQVLGETWINHYGHHNVESTRGLIAKGMEKHPLARGVEDIWGDSDVYGLTTLHGDCKPVIMGQVLKGMKYDDPPNPDKKLVPVAWTRTYTGEKGKTSQIFTTTMGHSFDFLSEGFRRLMVNACYWAVGLEADIPARANVDFVGEYKPSGIGYGKCKKGLVPNDYAMQSKAEKKKIKVFLLAGQSNMEGQGVVAMDHPKYYNGGKGNLVNTMKDSVKADRYKHLKDKQGRWVVRDDVSISFRDRNGGLTIGYTGYGGDSHIGPELQFGHVIGDYYDEPVLIIKTAWGGKSLYKDFRPPSSGLEVGPWYKQMVEYTHDALENISSNFPNLTGREYEIVGFVWMQGWNDMCTPEAIPQYADNLVNLVADLRKEFDSPEMPVVIGELGNGGPDAKGSMAQFRAAQRAGADRINNAKFVTTSQFARPAELSPNTGHGHHWFGSAESYFLIGDALGRAMIELIEE